MRQPPNCPEEYGTHVCRLFTTHPHAIHICYCSDDVTWRTGDIAPASAYDLNIATREQIIALAKLKGLR